MQARWRVIRFAFRAECTADAMPRRRTDCRVRKNPRSGNCVVLTEGPHATLGNPVRYATRDVTARQARDEGLLNLTSGLRSEVEEPGGYRLSAGLTRAPSTSLCEDESARTTALLD